MPSVGELAEIFFKPRVYCITCVQPKCGMLIRMQTSLSNLQKYVNNKTLPKKFSRSQITERDTSCNVEVEEAFDELFPVALAGKDFNRSLLSSSNSAVFFNKLKSTRRISRAT